MKTNGSRRGSVLMEFIIVFPIYLVLFAGLVAIGDRVLHSNRLISADRAAAYEVDGRSAGYAERIGWSSQGLMSWRLVPTEMFHPGREVADDGADQDDLKPLWEAHYADSTGPWSVCALSTAHDTYRPLAGGTLGQLLAAHLLLGGGGTVTNSGLLSASVNMVSKDTRNGAAFYTLKRRDRYLQRLQRRTGTNEYIDPDASNWRDRDRVHISRLLVPQGDNQTENWRLEVAGEGWHTAETINGGSICTKCTEASGGGIPDYERYDEFVKISD